MAVGLGERGSAMAPPGVMSLVIFCSMAILQLVALRPRGPWPEAKRLLDLAAAALLRAVGEWTMLACMQEACWAWAPTMPGEQT